jgi:hypothetical protein
MNVVVIIWNTSKLAGVVGPFAAWRVCSVEGLQCGGVSQFEFYDAKLPIPRELRRCGGTTHRPRSHEGYHYKALEHVQHVQSLPLQLLPRDSPLSDPSIFRADLT